MNGQEPSKSVRRRDIHILEDGWDYAAQCPVIPLPRGLGDRVLLGLLSATIAFASGLTMYALRTGEEPANRVFRFILVECAGLVFSFSCLALLWAIATPRFVERLLVRRALQLGVVGFAVAVSLLIGMLYSRFFW